MHISLNFDPNSPAELADAERTLRLLRSTPGVPEATDGSSDAQLRDILSSLANPNRYQENRLGYLKRVAEAGEAGASANDLRNNHFGGSGRRYGGTHSSIERSWKSLGGQQFAPQLIEDRAGGARQVMYAPARDLVMEICAS